MNAELRQNSESQQLPEAAWPLDDERRSGPRIPVEKVREVIVRTANGDEFAALGRDDSARGMGVLVEEPVDLQVGDSIELCWQGVELKARVAHIEPRNHGVWALGFAWEFIAD